MSLPPAVILGGAENAVSVARSLDSAGIVVHAVGQTSSPVRYSRSCHHFADVNVNGSVQAAWLQWLEREGPRGAVVLPCDDDGVELIARHRQTLVDRGYLVFEADDQVMLDMLDKDRTYELAREIGVDSPSTFTVRTEAELDEVLSKVSYPVGLKPVHAHLFKRHSGTGLKAMTVHDRAELERNVRDFVSRGLDMLITEIVPGAEDQFAGYYSYLDADGQPLFHFTKQKVRQNPPVFGDGSYHVTTWDPEVARLGLEFFQGVGVRGLANVEFKRDARDGRWKLIECNHRFTAINELLRASGCDVALFAYNRLVGRPTPKLDGYRTGVRIWQPLNDARAAWALLRRRELSVESWARSWAASKHVPMFRWDDPAPTLGKTYWRLRKLSARLAERTGR